MTAKLPSKLEVRWRIAERLIDCAEEVRNARKPADLTFPAWRIIYLVRELKENQYEWLEKVVGLGKKDRGQWPHL